MSFGDLYSVPAGQDPLPGPPIDLPQVERPRPRTSLTVGPKAVEPADPWAAAGVKIKPPGQSGEVEAKADPWGAAGIKLTPAGQYKPEPEKTAPEIGTAEAAGNEAAHSATFGLTPALAGAMSAGRSPEENEASREAYASGQWPSALGEAGDLIKGLGKLGLHYLIPHVAEKANEQYEKGRQEAQDRLEAGREQHSMASFAGGLAGSLVTPLPGLGPATLGARLAKGAASGAIGGAATGAGSALSEGKDLGDIARAAGTQGTIGGVLGGTLGAAIGSRLPTGSAGERAAETARRLGAPIPKGLASDSGALQSTTASMGAFPLAGARISSLVDETRKAAGEHIEGIISKKGGLTDRAASNAIVGPGLEKAVDFNKAKIDANYNLLRGQIDQNARFKMPRTQAALQGIRQDRANAGWANPSQGLEQFENVANGATFNGAHRARTDARAAGNPLVPNPGYNAADFNRLTRAMGADIRDMAAAAANNATPAGRKAAVEAFDKAEREFGPIAEQNKLLHRLINNKGEGAIGSLLNAAKEKGGNAALLAQLKKSMDPQDFQAIGAQLLHELGHNPATGEFSLAKFATGLGKTSEGARRILFDPKHKADIEDIAGLGMHIKKALKDSNTSHTANAVILFDLAKDAVVMASTGALAHVLSVPALAGIAAASPALMFAHWLASPAKASSMAAWSRAHAGMLNHPTPARQAAFTIATRNLSHNLGLPAETIMQRLAAPAGARAEDDQPNGQGAVR